MFYLTAWTYYYYYYYHHHHHHHYITVHRKRLHNTTTEFNQYRCIHNRLRSERRLVIRIIITATRRHFQLGPSGNSAASPHQTRSSATGRSKGSREGPCPPPSPRGHAQNALKVTFLDSKSKRFSGEGAMPPPQTPASFPLHSLNHNVVSNTLMLSPRAICIHTTASFPTSNGFWRLKRVKHSMEE